MLRGMFAYACTAWIMAAPAIAEEPKAVDLPSVIFELLHNDDLGTTHGVAYENDERHHRSITVHYTGKEGDSVERQAQETAEAALRIGHLAVDRALSPPGEDLIIKMSLRGPGGWFIDTFSVRYRWADVLTVAKARAPVADLAATGKIETIWPEYWPSMCLNQPPPELFAGSNGPPEEPEDVENPTRKDLSCHRRR